MKNVFYPKTSTQFAGMSAAEFAEAYLKDVNFEEYASSLRKTEVEDFSKFIDFMKRGILLSGRIGEGVDRGGRYYKFYTFIRAKGTDGCKIFPIGEWNKVVEDYLDGNLRIAFTASELADAMMNP